MTTTDRQIVGEVLGRMADEAPQARAIAELRATRVQRRPGETPQSTRTKRPLTILAFAAMATVLLVGGLVLVTGPRSPVVAGADDVFLLPGYVPDGLTLIHAEMLDAEGETTGDPDQAAGTFSTYLVPGNRSWVEGDRVLEVGISDHLATTSALLERDELTCLDVVDDEDVPVESETYRQRPAEPECVGLARIQQSQLDPAAFISVLIENAKQTYRGNADVTFTETSIRGKPTLVIEKSTIVNGIEDHSVDVIIFEGGGVISSVAGHQIDQTSVLRVAEELRPATPEEFIAYAATAER